VNSSISQEPGSGPSEAIFNEGSVPTEPNPSMAEYYSLQNELFATTLIVALITFVFVWTFYSFNLALNYGVWACVGGFYLKMLAKDVERLGENKKSLSYTRIVLFVGLIVLATKLNDLKISPILLGFLTYKAALVIYLLRKTFLSSSK
jgi:ATP synthase protein I